MTGYNARLLGQTPNGTNIKDGHGSQPRPKPLDWEGAGFVHGKYFNSHNYSTATWVTYTVQPGQVGQHCGFIVRLGDTDLQIFLYDTAIETIRDWIETDAAAEALDWAVIEEELEAEGMVIPF